MNPVHRPLPEGIYTPLPTFFKPDEDLDLTAFAQHVTFTASAGTFPVVAGSAGEAPHLTPAERIELIKTARKALDTTVVDGWTIPIVAGVGAPSTRETITLAKEAASAGADFVMVIPPGYYAGALKSGSALLEYFVDVAQSSPVPVVLYNFPAVAGGLDLDSDLIVEVVKRTNNVVGVKLTCASVGKITRINAVVASPEFKAQYPRCYPDQDFRVIDGFIDILMPSVACGAAGAISGLPNIAPKVCVRLWKLASCGCGPGSAEYQEAQRLQSMIALADGVLQGIGIAGLKIQ
ncbi:hypothetical protein N0V82_004395 [Gnomoniopsis sp. IMI 355080]|nr:hypothetical protein N0V82_004395 [Gnomoniopsis sp. IMI 355080]